MENTMNNPKKDDELELTQFFRWIGRGFQRFGNSIIYLLAALRNLFFTNRVFFIVIIVLGLVIGAIYSELLNKKYYKSTMVLGCDYLNTQILSNTIEKLNLLSAEPTGEGLAEELQIDVKTALNVLEFEFKPFVSENDIIEIEVLKEQLNNVAADKKNIVDKVIEKLEIENKDAYQLTVTVYNPSIVKPLETALIEYFKQNGYIKRRVEIHKINLNDRKQKLITESKKLDSLKKVIIANLGNFSKSSRGSNNVFLNEEGLNNPLDIFTQDLQLNNEILEINKELYIQPDFEVVDGFTTYKKPESASLMKVLIISFLLALLIGYLIVGIWRFDRMLANYSTKL
jgi:hypothetical protein